MNASSIVVPALTDSLGVGTLALPLWLAADPAWRPRLVALYCAIVACAYCVEGAVVLVLFRVVVVDDMVGTGGRVASWACLVAGIGGLAWGVRLDRGHVPSEDDRSGDIEKRLLRPRTVRGVVMLAVGASVADVATMAPYLSVIHRIGGGALPRVQEWGWLCLYCCVMLAPAGALILLRAMAGNSLVPVLLRLQGAVEMCSGQVASTALMAGGGLLAANAAITLGLIHA